MWLTPNTHVYYTLFSMLFVHIFLLIFFWRISVRFYLSFYSFSYFYNLHNVAIKFLLIIQQISCLSDNNAIFFGDNENQIHNFVTTRDLNLKIDSLKPLFEETFDHGLTNG